MKYLLSVLIVLSLLFMGASAFASDISDALYQGELRITNSGNVTATGVCTTANISSQGLIDTLVANSELTDVAVQYNGEDIKFMPGIGTNSWVFLVPTIEATTNFSYDLYTGGASGGTIAYFPGNSGLNCGDILSGDNFTVSIDGYIDTSDLNGNLVTKSEALDVSIDTVTSGTVNATLLNPYCLDYVDTNSDYTTINDNDDFSFTDGNDLPFSVLGWVNLDDATNGTLLNKYDSLAGANKREWKVSFTGTDKFGIFCYKVDDGAVYIATVSTAAITGYEGSWTHFAATYDGSEATAGFNLYINGYAVADTDASGGAYAGMTNSASDLLIGATIENGGATSFLDGPGAEVKLYDVELSAAQILADYQGTLKTSDMVGYWKLNEGTGNPEDYSGNGFDASANLADWVQEYPYRQSATVSATSVTSGEQEINVGMDSPFFGMAIDTDLEFPITDDLVLNAPLWQEECNYSSFTTIDDNELTATVTGATWTNQGYTFDGGDYITISDDAALDITTNLSVSCWAYVTNIAGAEQALVSKYNTAGNKREWYLYKDNATGKIGVNFGDPADGTTEAIVKTSSAQMVNSTFAHIGFSFSPNTCVIYVNGSAVASSVTFGAVPASLYNNTADVEIGSYGGGSSKITGGIGEATVHSSTLTPTEFLQNYNATKSKYTSGDIYCYSTLDSVVDNSEDLVLCAGGVSYMNTASVTIGGSVEGQWEWEYDTTFTDLSGNGNDATPSFRTSTSDANVTASLINFGPIQEAEVDTFTLSSSYELLLSDPSTPDNMFDDSDYSYLPAEPINELLDEAEVPQAAWWHPFLFIGLCIIGFIVYGATTLARSPTGKLHEGYFDGSLLTMFIVMEAGLVLFGKMGPIPLWPAYIFPIAGVAIIFSRKHFSWG